MIRALLELLFMIAVVLVARAVLTSVFRGIARASQQAAMGQSARPDHAAGAQSPRSGGDLHRDPICGTFVAESSRFKRQSGAQTYYYCSQECREKHALVAH